MPRLSPAVAVSLAVFLLLSAVAATYLASSRGRSDPRPARQITSLAVLPFQSLSADPQDEFLGLGLTDALITRLSNVQQLNVRPTSAVRKYAGRQDAVAAGRELQVESVLEGSVHRIGERIRLTVRLIDVEGGGALWAETFDEQFSNVFAVEERLSRDLAEALTLNLSAAEIARVEKHSTQDAGAYALYLNGRFCLNRFTEDGTKLAREYFRRAIDKDPDYAQAYAGLAESFAFGEIGLPPGEAFPQAREAVTRALRLDASLGEAHAVLAQVKFLDEWDWSGAEQEFRLAIALTPHRPETHHMYAHFLTAMGRTEDALAESMRFLALDPISPTPVQHLGWHHLYARQFDKAIDQYRKVLAMDPNYIEAHRQLADAYWQRGLLDEAVSEMEKQLTLQGRSEESLRALRAAYSASGWAGYWRKRLDLSYRRARETYVAATTLAEGYARSGDRVRALEWLEKAYRQRDHQLVYLNQDYVFAEFHHDPSFQSILGRLRLNPE
jgi:TolB-like protein/thioredoxin-like negative regulator of GroEL